MLFNHFEVKEDQYHTPLLEIGLDTSYYNHNPISSHLGIFVIIIMKIKLEQLSGLKVLI